MSALLPILAAVLQASSFTLDKAILSLGRVSFRTYTGISFPLIFLITFGIFLVFRPPISLSLFSGFYGGLVATSVIMTIANNLIFYRALDRDKLSEIQMVELLPAIPVIIFSSIIFADERNFWVLVPALVASLATVWSHWERRHFELRRATFYLLAWSLIAAPIGAYMAKVLLRLWNPIALEMVRSGAVAAVLCPLFFRSVKAVPRKALYLLLLTNILTSVAWILFYFSYQQSGIIYTLLLFSLQPILVYFASVLFLGEKMHKKKSLAFIIIFISIAAAQVMSRP